MWTGSPTGAWRWPLASQSPLLRPPAPQEEPRHPTLPTQPPFRRGIAVAPARLPVGRAGGRGSQSCPGHSALPGPGLPQPCALGAHRLVFGPKGVQEAPRLSRVLPVSQAGGLRPPPVVCLPGASSKALLGPLPRSPCEPPVLRRPGLLWLCVAASTQSALGRCDRSM